MFNYSKIQLSLLVLLVLLFSSCKFNEEIETPDSSKPITQESSQKYIYVTQEGIYLLNKNWNQSKLDSLLEANPKYILIEGEQNPVFINQYADSIEINITKISRKNPVIIFNKDDGPILTSIERIKRYLEEYAKPTIIPENKPKIPKPNLTENNKLIKTKKTENTDTLYKLHSLYLDSIEISISRILKERDLGEHSQYYPIIPDKKNLEIYFDNDFWDFTDYYYTNGIRLGLTHPVFTHSPLSYLLVSNATNGLDYYGVHIIQHMYTGSQPKVDTTIPGDRPWAAYSVIGQYATSFDQVKKIKHESEINIGILGPKSGGGFLQDLVHTILPNNSPPEGWENQIKTDVIIDYQYKIYKSLFESGQFESYVKASVQAGTLRDNLKWGFGARYGKFTPFYMDYQNQVYKREEQKIYYSIFGDIETQLIGYDATLQGGVTDRTSVYVIPTRDMERFVIQGYVGLEFTFRRMQLQFIQYWKSREFKTGKDHKYVSVRLYFGL